ncbi:MAG: DEAD/DEAH box helicase family protein [Bacteroidales bacterium]|nr:DEAD/DEAH box helicase family protein [Bacteroidales bacterium]
MACGTGKTFTSLRIAEALAGKSGECSNDDIITHLRNQKVLFLVPSIALLGQTLREWCFDAQQPLRPMCICSDSEVSRTHQRRRHQPNDH